MTPSQRLSAIAKVLDEYTNYTVRVRVGAGYVWKNLKHGPQFDARDFTKLKQLANPKKSKRKGKR